MNHAGNDSATPYEIVIAGSLDARWQAWFVDFTVTATAQGDTFLRGPVRDQASLHGVLKRINNLGLRLISVNPIPKGEMS